MNFSCVWIYLFQMAIWSLKVVNMGGYAILPAGVQIPDDILEVMF